MRDLPGGSTVPSVRTARPCRPANERGSPWHGSCWRTGRGCSWTSPPPTSTPLTERVIADTVAGAGVQGCGGDGGPSAGHGRARRPRAEPRRRAAPAARRARHRGVPSRAPTPVDRPSAAEAAPQPTVAARALGLSTVVGALASASGVALTATAGWLIVQASTQPGVLTLLAAIVAVRMFGVARPGAALRREAGFARRSPAAARPSPRRGLRRRRAPRPCAARPPPRGRAGLRSSTTWTAWSTASCGCGLPARSYAIVATLAAAVTAVVLLPPAGLVVALTCLVAGAGGWSVARLRGRPAPSATSSTRALRCLPRCVETLQVASELRMWQGRIQHAAEAPWRNQRSHRPRRTRGDDWSGAARALVLATTGVGRGSDGSRGIGGPVPGELSGPMLALLVLIPLALAEVAAPLTEAGALSVRTAEAAAPDWPAGASRHRRSRDTVATGFAAPRRRSSSSDVRARWDVDAPLTDARCRSTSDRVSGSRWWDRPDPARAPSPHCSCASSTPRAAG